MIEISYAACLVTIILFFGGCLACYFKGETDGFKKMKSRLFHGERPPLLLDEQISMIKSARDYFENLTNDNQNTILDTANDILISAHQEVLEKTRNFSTPMSEVIDAFKFLFYAEIVQKEAARRHRS